MGTPKRRAGLDAHPGIARGGTRLRMRVGEEVSVLGEVVSVVVVM